MIENYIKINHKSDNLLLRFLLGLIIFICFWGQFERDEWTPDEPRVVAISMEMAQTRDFIVPHLAGHSFIEKPPLYFALAAGTISLLPTLEPIAAIRILNISLGILTLYFTFLLARELKNSETGYLAAIVLGTMEGFVVQTHWSRVDNLLLLTVIASVWALYTTFARQQYSYLLLGAFLAGLAFLVKGLIGPVLIGVIWLAIVIRFGIEDLRQDKRQRVVFSRQSILTHFVAVVVFALVAGSWVVMLKYTTTEDIWHEWFWVNNVGRFNGTTPVLGHLNPGKPFYYLKSIAEYTLPWLPVLVATVSIFVMRGVKHKQYDTVLSFLFLVITITLILLSMSVTKRSLYLLPLLPFFAIAIACSFTYCVGKWTHYFQHLWFGLCLVVMTALLLLPSYAFILANKIPVNILHSLSEFNWRSLLVLLSVMALVYVWASKRYFKWFHKIALATVLLYFSVLSFANPIINQVKSMRNNTDAFIKKVPVVEREYIAGYLLSETALATLVISNNWKVTVLHDVERIENILLGKDPNFNSVLIEHRGEITDLLQTLDNDKIKYRIVATGFYRGISKDLALYWIKGMAQ